MPDQVIEASRQAMVEARDTLRVLLNEFPTGVHNGRSSIILHNIVQLGAAIRLCERHQGHGGK